MKYFLRFGLLTVFAFVFTQCTMNMKKFLPLSKAGAKVTTVESQDFKSRLDFALHGERTKVLLRQMGDFTKNRIEKISEATSDGVVSDEENTLINEMTKQENVVFEELIKNISVYTQNLLPQTKKVIKVQHVRDEISSKYIRYDTAVIKATHDQQIDESEKTIISERREGLLNVMEKLLPLLPMPVKGTAEFVIQEKDPGKFFDITGEIDDMKTQLQELRNTILSYESVEPSKVVDKETGFQEGITINIAPEGSEGALEKAEISTPSTEKQDSLFFDTRTDMNAMKEEIKTLKSAVRFYELASKGLPELDEDVLNILKLPTLRHKIMMKNGTVVVGQILEENLDKIVMQTSIGKLVIEKDKILRYDEKDFPTAHIVFEGDYQINEFDEYNEIIGVVKNVGKKRADFVKVSFYFWDEGTKLIASRDGFVDGIRYTFETGVIADSSIEPLSTVTYKLRVEKLPDGKQPAYVTNEVTWVELK